MTINLKMPEIKELKPKITVFGVGGAGGNAVNNMIRCGLMGCEFVVANTDSQALMASQAERMVQMGVAVTEGLGAGSQPEVGRAAAEEAIDEIGDHLNGSHMVFVTAGMGGGTGTGAAPIIARKAREHGILTVGVVTKPFQFEGIRRMRVADQGILDLQDCVDTLIVIPNQNLFRIANEKTTFADAFAMADQVLYSGVACITDLMVKEGLINLDFADVRSVMREMGKAMMGTGEASGERRATQAAEAAIANPLLDETTMRGARGLLISITGGKDLTLFEVDEAATRIREEVDPEANIILGATFEESLEGVIRVSVVATGIEAEAQSQSAPAESRMAELSQRLRASAGAQQAAPTALAPETAAAANAQPAAAPAPQPRAAAAKAPAADAGNIRIGPLDPRPADYGSEEIAATPAAEAPTAAAAHEPFIAPPAERPAARIPRVDDFPPLARRQMQAQRGAESGQEDDRGPLSLLKRLASVGLGRREEDPIGAGPPTKAGQAGRQRQEAEPKKRPRQAAASPRDPQAGLYRPPQGDLDAHGRQVPRESRPLDDELEIPAFLRRQAN